MSAGKPPLLVLSLEELRDWSTGKWDQEAYDAKVAGARLHALKTSVRLVELYESGHVSLAAALVKAMELHPTFPVPLRLALQEAVFAFRDGLVDDRQFARLLGLPGAGTTARRRLSKYRQAVVPELVKLASAQGLPKTDPSLYDKTAFHEVGKHLQLSAHTVYSMWKSRPRPALRGKSAAK